MENILDKVLGSSPKGDSSFDATTQVESNNRQFDKEGNPLRSSAGAIGTSQVMPTTGPEAAALAGVKYNALDLALDPEYNKKLGKAYLDKQISEFNDVEKGHAAYNAGPNAVKRAIEKGGDNWKDYLPAETKQYLEKIKVAKEKLPVSSTESTVTETPTKTNVLDEALGSKKPVESSNRLDQVLGTSDASAGKVFAKGLAGSATQALAVAPFMATGAEIGGALGTTFGPWGTITGTIIGGIGGAIGGDKFITAVTDTLPDRLKEVIGYDKATREAERKAHPEAAFTADLGGNLVLFRPGSLATIVLKDGTKIGSTAQRVGMGALGAGIETGQQLMGEGELDPAHIAESAAFEIGRAHV